MLTTLTRVLCAALLIASLVPARAAAHAQQPRPPAQQSEFVPVDELPQADQIPAAPLVIAAYAVAWLAIFFYLFSIWRRLQKVEKELGEVARRVGERSRT
ncbi:MAG: CcmD family protein [Acidobacteria bacterium]|nr:CcmD family protein [Acidobacteriota bacterium]